MEGEGFLRSGHANRQVGVPASRWAGAYASRWARVYVRRNIRSGERALLQRVRGGKYEESEHEGRRMRGNEHEAERSRGRCRASPSLRTKKCRMVTKKNRPFLVFEGLSKAAHFFAGEITGRGTLLIRHYVAVRKCRELFCEVISHYEEARLIPFGTFLPRKLPKACQQRGKYSG